MISTGILFNPIFPGIERTREQRPVEGPVDTRSEALREGWRNPADPGSGSFVLGLEECRGRSSIRMGASPAGAVILTLFLRTARADWGEFAYFYRYANQDQPILFPFSFAADYRCRAQLCPGQHW